MPAFLFRITGRVQGVWFRAWTAEKAAEFGVDGWVRNRRDGSVEALVSGPEEAVARMRTALYQGPPLARVDAVEREPAEPPEEPGFEQQSSV